MPEPNRRTTFQTSRIVAQGIQGSELRGDQVLDLSSCDREPIHIPGSIQPHGFLLALGSDARVAAGSSTAAEFLATPMESVFGNTLQALFGPEAAKLEAALAAEPISAAARLLPNVHLGPQTFEPVVHLSPSDSGPLTILEFEEAREPADPEILNARLYNIVGQLRQLRTIEALCEHAVDQIGSLTGCDRVVLYRFDEAGHGQVLSETLHGDCFESYLGLRFPASDVPAQARRMYLLNRVRIIPDVDYRPSPLLSPQGASAPEIDLSSSVLRSVSPIHREYMRNMGTVCSMSVSIIIDGKLWGLVSCHHHAPRFLSLRLRSACDFLMQIVASEIEAHEKSARLERALEARSVAGRLLASVAAQSNPDNYLEGLTRAPALLQQLTVADGAAVVTGMSVQLFGHTPPEAQILRFVEWLGQTGQDELFATDRLASLYPGAAAFAPEASGVLAIALSRLRNTHILWFRQELVQTVRWAGNPNKPAEASGGISPRHSFQEWQETVRQTARSWTPEDIDAAREFRSAMLEVVLSRTEEIAELAQGLQVANQELEAFSYSVSHDLRAPFRHISGFAEMLRDQESDRLTDRGRRYLATILESARFAGLLVDSLLDFSRFARVEIHMSAVNMEELVDHEWQAVLEDEARDRAANYEFSRSALPRVLGAPQLLRQVLRNLFSNAVKYTGKQVSPKVRVESRTEGQEFIFSIADNGVGFDSRFAGKLFGVFQRLHRIEEFEGTGIGLANVRRIIQRHGGRTWAEGEVGKGATFFFTLPLTFPSEQA